MTVAPVSSVAGLVTPWIVSSPVTLALPLPVGVTFVEVKVISGYWPASSHCALRNSSSSLPLVVITDATGMLTLSALALADFGSSVSSPDAFENVPVKLEKPMCDTEKVTWVWAGSTP